MKTTKKAVKVTKVAKKTSPKAKSAKSPRVEAALRIVSDLRAHLAATEARLNDANVRLDLTSGELARVKRERDTWARAADEATQATVAARRAADEAVKEKVDSEAKLFALASEAGGASDAAIASVQRSAVKAGIEAAVAPAANAPTVHAYLMAHLDLATMKVVDAMIMSDPYPTQVRSGMRWLRIMDVEASSYDEAHNRLFESVIAETSHANWARRWVLEHDATMPHPGDVFLSAGAPVAAVAAGVVTAVGHEAKGVVVTPGGVSVDFPALAGPPPALKERDIGKVIDAALALMGVNSNDADSLWPPGPKRAFVEQLRRIKKAAGFTAPEIMSERWTDLVLALQHAVKDGVLPAPTSGAPEWVRQLSDLIEGRLDADAVLRQAPPAPQAPPALSPHEQEVRRYVEHHVCPRCGSEVDVESKHERDSSNDVHCCEKCGWSCGEVEVWAAEKALQAARSAR